MDNVFALFIFRLFWVHKFYEGKILLGFIYLLTFGFLGFGIFIDLIIILTKPKEYYL